MSYILDALKKSERERALGNIPTLNSGAPSEARRVPLSWFIGLLVVLTSVALLFGGWRFWQSTQQPAPVADTEPAPSAVAVEPALPATAADNSPGAVDVPVSREPVGKITVEPHTYTAPEPVVIGDLDPSIRNRLPDLSVNALSYSDNKSKRFVMINQSIYKEGQNIGGGIVVDEISKTRVVLSFEGVRFLLLP